MLIANQVHNSTNLLFACRTHMAENGLELDADLVADGHIHRYSVDHKRTEPDEWYIAWEDVSSRGTPSLVCIYGSWSENSKFEFKSWEQTEFSSIIDDKEREALQRSLRKRREQAHKAQLQAQEEAAKRAYEIWENASEQPQNENQLRYPNKKGIQPVGVRFGKNPNGFDSIIIPLRNIAGEIRSLQFISAGDDGKVYKTFLSGGEKKGNFFQTGPITQEDRIFVAEGYATGVSVNKATASPTIIAFDSGNLSPVTQKLREKYPKNEIIIAGDNDENNVGQQKAEDASKAHGCKVVLPSFPDGKEFDADGKRYSDFNDLEQVCGIDEVVKLIKIVEATETPEEEIPDYVIEFNKKHAVIHQSKTYILTEKHDPLLKRQTFSLEPDTSFNLYYRPQRSEDGKKQLSTLWLASPYRREYPGGIIFDPKTPGHFNGYYNLFQGFSIEPKRGKCDLFWELVYVLSGCDKQIAAYIRKWLAHLIQRPWEIPGVAIAFRGLQGTGKGTLMRYISQLVLRHYFEASQMNLVVGKFNSHLKDVILVYANEAIWGGNKAEIGVLKAMITDECQAIEQKGVDVIQVRNCKRWVFSSNEDWIVPMDIDDRRFLVVDVNPKHKEDEAFFNALDDQMNHGGLEALMWDLSNEDISGWHPRKKPRCINGFDLKLRSMKTPHRWLYECLSKELHTVQLSDDDPTWRDGNEIRKTRIYDDYKYFCEERHDRVDDERLFWKSIIQILGPLDQRKLRIIEARVPVVKFPSLAEAREAFANFAKEDGDQLWEE